MYILLIDLVQVRWTPVRYGQAARTEALFSFQKISKFSVTSNLVAHTWSIKCRQNQILITQFTCNSRAESFEFSYSMIEQYLS